MASNLAKGDAGEVFLRWWLDGSLSLPSGMRVAWTGFTAEGVDQSPGKTQRIMSRARSPDFSLERRRGDDAELVLGISCNTQSRAYTGARGERCSTCARGAFERCAARDVHNLWFTTVHLMNDYRLFRETYGAEVICVSVVAPWMRDLSQDVAAAGLGMDAKRYVAAGVHDEGTARVANLAARFARLGYRIAWIARPQVRAEALEGLDDVPGGDLLTLPQIGTSHTAKTYEGGSSYSRDVTCLDIEAAGDEAALVALLGRFVNKLA